MVSASWKDEPLGSVATLQRGFDLPSRLREPGAVPIVTSSGVEARHCEAKVKGPGVVTGRYGTIGEVFFVRADFWPLNTTLYVRDFHGNDPLFISYVLRTIDFHTHSGKSGVPGVNRNDLHEIEVPFPPTKAEQEAIAEALSDADALIESLEQLLSKKRQLKQGAMQELLTGKKRLPGFQTQPGHKQTEVGLIPEDWDSTTVREIASPIRNAIVGGPFGSDLVSKDYVDAGIPVVRGQNMGSRFVSGGFAFVTQAKATSLEANLARAGDLVFTQRGTLGQVSLVPDQPHDRYLISQSQMKLTVNRRAADPLFFYYAFSSEQQQEFIRQNTIQTGVPHINLRILRDLPVQRPPLAEQEAIAAILSDMDAEIAALEAKLAKARSIKQGMMQELLTGRIRLV